MGSSSSSSQQPTAVEAPNTLQSISRIKILDLLCEGPISGLARQSGVYGNDPLTATFYDDTTVRNTDGSYNYNVSGQGFAFKYTLGTSGQSVMQGFERIENILPLPSNNRIANPPAGGGSYKTVNASFNTSLYPDADSMRVTVRIPALYTINDIGSTNGYELKYAVDISLNGGAFSQLEEVTINGKCTSPYVKSTSYTLPKTNPASSYYEWKVRVRRTTTNILSTKTANEIFVDSIVVISNSSFSYPNSVLVGTEIAFDQFSSLPTRAYEVEGLLINVPLGYTPTTYNADGTITVATYPTIWNGTFAASKRWTNNPAFIFYDLLTNKRYGLGNYIQAGGIDKWTLYEIAQYCDELVSDGEGGLEPRFTCNVVIQERQDAYQLLLNLSSIFRGMLYWSNGRIFATQTSDKNPIFNFTNANVIGGNFTYSDSAGSVRSTVALVKFTDPSNFYRESTVYLEDRDGIARYGYIPKEVTAFGATSKGQAYRIGNWILTSERLLTETISFQAGLDGQYLRPGDVFNVYDNFRNNSQQGGRIEKINSARNVITLDRTVNLESGNTYSLSAIVPTFNLETTGEITGSDQIEYIRNSQIEVRQVSTPAASGVSSLSVTSAYSTGLFPGAVFILSASGASGNIYQKASLYQCVNIIETDQGQVDIMGLEYNTGLNGIVERTYSVVSNPINSGDNSPIEPPSGLLINIITGLYSDNTYFSYLELGWTGTSSNNFSFYKVSGQRFGGAWENTDNVNTTGSNLSITVTGQYNFKVAAISQGGVSSSFISNSYTVPATNPLGNVTNLSGLVITENYDPNYNSASGYTGYYDTQPTFTWIIPTNGSNNIPQAQFISGYRVKILDPVTNTNLLNAQITLAGLTNTTYKLAKNLLVTGLNGGQRRLIKPYIEVVDTYGNISSGASLVINNPVPTAPASSGFAAIYGGLNYTVNPQYLDTDISGIYLWINESNSFSPTFANKSFTSANLAGFASTGATGLYYVWYSLVDTYGTGGSNIYGPVGVTVTAGLTGIRSNNNPYIGGSVTFRQTGNISLTQSNDTILISGSGYNITGAIDTFTNNYNSNSPTLNNYTTAARISSYAGINSGIAGNPYATVSDLNDLRTAYENLRASYDNNIQVQSQLITSLKKLGLAL